MVVSLNRVRIPCGYSTVVVCDLPKVEIRVRFPLPAPLRRSFRAIKCKRQLLFMNIIYTINGEGMGHAMRSVVILEYLKQKGHQLMIVVGSERGARHLAEAGFEAHVVHGFHMSYQDNTVRRLQTALVVSRALKYIRRDSKDLAVAARVFAPDVVITDFDIYGTYLSLLLRVPLISLDNIQVVTKSRLAVGWRHVIDYGLNWFVARAFVPRANAYIISSFNLHLQKKKRKNVFFVAPIVRSAIRNATVADGDHILVYQTSDSYERLWNVLAASGQRYIVYGAQGSPAANITYKPFSKDEFVHDFVSAKAVISNGGYTLLSETVFLGKPILSIPIAHHFEQQINGATVSDMGFGMTVDRLTAEHLQEFIKKIPQYAASLSAVHFDPDQVYSVLDRELTRIADREQ